jgi:hypothetical protein
MSTRFIQFLCLACGLVVALPPAWCCWTPQLPTPAPAEPTTASCCHKHESPPPAPAVPAPPQCPCEDRCTVAAAAVAPEKVAIHLALPTALVLTDADTLGPGLAAAVAPIPPLLSRPIHLLQCVWLC